MDEKSGGTLLKWMPPALAAIENYTDMKERLKPEIRSGDYI
jgi:hypothetical protein